MDNEFATLCLSIASVPKSYGLVCKSPWSTKICILSVSALTIGLSKIGNVLNPPAMVVVMIVVN